MQHAYISSIPDIMADARNGRLFILIDDEDEQCQGSFVIPAQMATPAAISFMATYGRGLIRLALTKQRVHKLGLAMMGDHDGASRESASTVSIEARTGVSTGISAADRARTISAAINAATGDDLVSPGHVFPLVAQDGGVLIRAGHTEAAVDVSRLAGLQSCSVICQILNDTGSEAKLDELVELATKHDLKIGTIRDLIAYRRQHDHIVERIAQLPFDSEFGGSWMSIAYRNTVNNAETVALVYGTIDPDKPTLVRMHALSLYHDAVAEPGPRSGLLAASMRTIAEAGSGVIVMVNRATPNFMSTVMKARSAGASEYAKHYIEQLRDYGIGAQILSDLRVRDIVLLTDSHTTLVALAGYGLKVVEHRSLRGEGKVDRQPTHQ